MKKFFLIVLAVMLVGCASAKLDLETIQKMEIVENYGYVYTYGNETDTLICNDAQFYMGISKSGKTLVELIQMNGYWYMIDNTAEEKACYVTDSSSNLDSIKQLYQTSYQMYLESTDFEIIEVKNKITYVLASVDNPYYDPENITTYYTYTFELEGKEITFKLSSDPFEAIELLEGELPEGFSFEDHSVDVENNELWYYGESEPKYEYMYELKLVKTEEVKPSEKMNVNYEYNKDGKIIALDFELEGNECRYEFIQKNKSVDLDSNETYVSINAEEFMSNYWAAILSAAFSE